MKKKVLSSVLALSMTLSLLAGCGKSAETSVDKTAPAEEKTEASVAETSEAAATVDADAAVANLIAATEGTVDLTLWCSETDAYQNVMKELVDEFKAKYSDVDFNITIGVQSEATCKDDVLKDVEAAGDLFVFPDDQLPGLVEAGALQPVQATYTYDPKTENASQIVDAASVDGQLYAYPLTASNGYFLFYNKNLLSEDDVKSWDALLAAAEAQGKKVGMEVSGAWFMYGFFAGAGLELYLGDDGKNVCNWNATDTKYTGADVATAINEICKSPAMVNCGNDDAQAFALNGELIADVSGTWATSAYKEAYGDGYAAVKLPTFTVNGDQVQMGSFAGYKFLGVNAYSKQPGWAMLLAEFLTSEESQAKIAAATGEGPSNTKAASDAAVIAEPALVALAEQSKYATLQRVNDNFWGPGATLGQSLVEGNYDDVQKLLDEAVEGITQ